MYGFIKEVSDSGTIICTGNEECWPVLEDQIPKYARIADEIKSIEKGAIGGINMKIEDLRLDIKGLRSEGASQKKSVKSKPR
jgi:ABC-type phosphate transport system auxiliary subunit